MISTLHRCGRPGLGAVVLAAAFAVAAPCRATSLGYIDIEGAVEDLGSESVRERYWATVVLGRYPEHAPLSLPALLDALRDPEWPVRLGAARALEAVLPHATDHDAAAAALSATLRDPLPAVRTAAAFALVEVDRLPRSARPLLEEGAAGDAPLLRVASTSALARHLPDRTGATAERSRAAATAAALLLEVLATEEDGARYYSDCDDDCRNCRWDAERGTVEPPGLQAVRLGGTIALLDPRTAHELLPELIARYQDGSWPAFYAAQAMAPFLGDYRPAWIAALRSRDADSRRLAALSLGVLKVSEPGAVAGLVWLLREDPAVAGDAAHALRLLGASAKSAVPALQEVLLWSSDRALRESAGRALIAIDLAAVDPVVSRIEAGDPDLASWLVNRAMLSRL